MPDMKQTENVKAKGKIRVLKLKRETLRELDAGELKQAQGGHCGGSMHCWDYEYTTCCPGWTKGKRCGA